ncbi:MAG: glycyl-radical enzyme activating protein [Abditibacteriota bacterium]|nr:glycyl-radical enzyme activating protein [Abditibacteriota bacterium]
MSVTGIIFDIKEFALHDGEGVRTTVFLKGCPLRCLWCHNPEGQSPLPELFQKRGCRECGLCRRGCSHPDCRPFGRCLHVCPDNLITVAGRETDPVSLARELRRRSDAFGGITLSGGEPLLQPEFSLALLREFGGAEGDTCLETCGYAPPDVFRRVTEACRCVYMDLKLADPAEHKKYTGRDNALILANLETLRERRDGWLLRVPLIPGITDTEANLTALARLAGGAPVELLEYNLLAGAKYGGLGRRYGVAGGRCLSAGEAGRYFDNPRVRR